MIDAPYLRPVGNDLPRPNVVNDNGVLRVAGLLTPDEFAEIERIRNSQFFLVVNDGGDFNEPGRCRWSKSDFDVGHRHDYLTYMCVERPFRGIGEGLWAYVRATKDMHRREALLHAWPDLAESHREFARGLVPEQRGEAIYGLSRGKLLPIKPSDAARLVQRINSRRPVVPFYL